MASVLKCVDRILLRVPNVTAATRFYTQTLGLRLDRERPNAAALRFAEGDTELILHDDRQRLDLEIVLGVSDVQSMFNERDALGITFLTPPVPSGAGHRATIRDPFGNVLAIADRGDGLAETAAPGQGLFEDEESSSGVSSDRAALVDVYVTISRTADDLPYTPHFEQLYAMYTRPLPEPRPSRNDVWRLLLTLRKSGKLPKLGPATSKPPLLDDDAKQRLRDLLGADIGKRDRLPYSDRFDAIVAEFNKGFARAWSPHVVWRIIATLAK
ncbi:MAG: VOC family protein [Tepidisphaeraceae bacterium]